MSIKVKINNDWVDTNIQAVRGVNHVNSEDVYTKQESDALFSGKVDKTELDSYITNAADEEDISSIEENGIQKLKFADRNYEPLNASGKGYKILRKNIQIIDRVRKNILAQDMINEPNTIYEIRYDFDLNGTEISIPENCVLNFTGGSLSNGSIRLNDCILHNERFINIKLNDVYNRQLNLARLYNEKNTKEVNQSIFKNCTTLYIPNGEY